ncbi:HIT family protein [Brachybacterium sp. AOP25-B2-12]|uniref:HIT family protein n=1 Tax=Brachybacterium sp. AOP25-B2-12 TaxID=3457710 RepID=UPI0040349A63
MTEPHTGTSDPARRDGAPGSGVPVEDTGTFAGDPDGLQRLWTPHRMAYILGDSRPEDPQDAGQCPFCTAPGREDEDALIIHRGRVAFVILNLFPYNSGHLLVCPYRHVADYTDLTEDEVLEVAELTRTAMRVIREVSHPAGFNLGMNQGEVAGAGIAAHLHQHVVPRWQGDANFLPIIGRTKALPILLADTRRLYAEAWPAPQGTSGTDGPTAAGPAA